MTIARDYVLLNNNINLNIMGLIKYVHFFQPLPLTHKQPTSYHTAFKKYIIDYLLTISFYCFIVN